MRKPKIYSSELLLSTFVKKSNENVLIQYIRSLNKYIDYLESNIDSSLINDEDEEDNGLNDEE